MLPIIFMSNFFFIFFSGPYEVPQRLSLLSSHGAFPHQSLASKCVRGKHSKNRTRQENDFKNSLVESVGSKIRKKLSIFQNGDLCISILHPPVDDPQSGELPCERWNPTQNVRYVNWMLIWIDLFVSMIIHEKCIYNHVRFRTIMLSVVSLLNEPNTYSPANVDASVMYRRWRDSNGKDKEYENIIK